MVFAAGGPEQESERTHRQTQKRKVLFNIWFQVTERVAKPDTSWFTVSRGRGRREVIVQKARGPEAPSSNTVIVRTKKDREGWRNVSLRDECKQLPLRDSVHMIVVGIRQTLLRPTTKKDLK